MALIAGVVAFQQRSNAVDTAYDAETRRLVADAAALVDTNPDLALLLAAEAHRRDPGPIAESGLLRTLTRTEGWLGTLGAGNSYHAAEWLDDDTIVGVTETELHYFDAATHERESTVPLPAPVVLDISRRANVATAGSLTAIPLADGTVALAEDSELSVVTVGADPVRVVALSDDGSLLAAADTAGNLQLHDLGTGEVRWTASSLIDNASYAELIEDPILRGFFVEFDDLIFHSGLLTLLFDGDEHLVISAGVELKRLRLEDAQVTDEAVLTTPLPDPDQRLPRAVFSLMKAPDDLIVAQAGANAAFVVSRDFEVRSRHDVPTGRAPGDGTIGVRGIVLDRDGSLWFPLSNGQLSQLRPEASDQDPPIVTTFPEFHHAGRSPNGTEMAVAGPEGILRWSIDGRRLLGTAYPHGGSPTMIVAEDGSSAGATSNSFLDSVVFDMTGRVPESVDLGPIDPTTFIDVGPPGGRLITSMREERLSFYDGATMKPLEVTIPGMGIGAMSTNDGEWFVQRTNLLGQPDGVRVVEFPSLDPISPVLDLAPFSAETDVGMSGASFSPSNDRLAVFLASGTGVVFETTNWAVEHVITPDDHGGASAGRFLPDGSSLATRGADGSIVLRDPVTYEELQILEGGTTAADTFIINGPLISPDGEYLLTLRDQTPRLWHLPTSTDLGTFPHDPGPQAIGHDLGDQLQLVTSVGEYGILWNLDIDSWPVIACRAAGRNLTASEWDQLGPRDTDHRATCEQWPLDPDDR